jgi:hypothetical protein
VWCLPLAKMGRRLESLGSWPPSGDAAGGLNPPRQTTLNYNPGNQAGKPVQGGGLVPPMSRGAVSGKGSRQ